MFVGKVFYKKNLKLINRLQSTIYGLVNSNLIQKNIYNLNYLDSLNGVKNRKCLERDLGYKIEQGIYFDLYFLDIDDFKKINDECGHIIGTKILEAFSSELRKKLPTESIVYRYGGDEFVILITNNNVKINNSSTFARVDVMINEKLYRLNSSVGKYRWTGEKVSPEQILSMADLRMYKKKKYKKVQ